MKQIKRSEIWLADLGQNEGSEQRGIRPVLIIQNNVGNHYSPTVIVASITDGKKRYMPTHIMVPNDALMKKDSVIMLEQVRTIDKSKISRKVAVLDDAVMAEVDECIRISLGLVPVPMPERG